MINKIEEDKAPPPSGPSLAPLGRCPYFFWGFGLLVLKYNLDRAIARFGFGRSWYFWNYIEPHRIDWLKAVPPDDGTFFLVMLATSLPFLAIGIYLTLRRLRSAGLPFLLCLLFLIPVVNLVFFLVLALVPSEVDRRQGYVLPRSAGGSALLAVTMVGGVGALFAVFSTNFLHAYGLSLFVGLPFVMGLVSSLIYARTQPRGLLGCIGVAVLTVGICGAILIACAVEGFICLLMAAPIALAQAVMGGAIGYLIARGGQAPLRPVAMVVLLLSVPMTMGMESQAGNAPPLIAVTSSLVIDALPEKVWPNVVAFSPITEPCDWMLSTGVAYPTHARIDGEGIGAIRHCVFTTGEFVEPIEVWDENRLLRFSVAAQPEPMEELSPYPHLKTPHLHNYFQSREGELRLTALPGGKTLLAGTTWYTDEVWPAAYWQLWSDMIVHRIHLRVLRHIKALSEQTHN